MSASTADFPPQPGSTSVPVETGRPRDPRLDATLARIARFGELEPDWDSYGGDPPTSIARAEAGRWVEIVADVFGSRASGAAIPYSVAPLADGGVQLEWRGSRGSVELEVGPDGRLGYLFLAQGDNEPRSEEADEASWSDVLRRLQRTFSG